MIPPEVVAPKGRLPATTGKPALSSGDRSHTGDSARIKELGYTVGSHINLYGEHFELVSEPVKDGGCTVVQVVSGNDPAVRTLRLPVSLLLGAARHSGHKTKFGKKLH